eukprot:1143071-Pelagomonas_calceolata.AAC.3
MPCEINSRVRVRVGESAVKSSLSQFKTSRAVSTLPINARKTRCERVLGEIAGQFTYLASRWNLRRGDGLAHGGGTVVTV